MQIVIKLLSDTCMASGEVYNSSVDTDVEYDKYGLPFIAAKRIKGCLRECALELNEWGKDIPINEMFGEKNNKPSAIYISNAKLQGYDTYVSEIKQQDRNLVHPQKILNEFTYTRSQTRIDENTGTAKENTLRVMRVLKKGLVFVADVDITGKDKESYKENLLLCCKILKHMGANRTRGMGDVEVALIDGITNKEPLIRNTITFDNNKKYESLDYVITLDSPVIFKSVAGGQTKTNDYIDGAKVLGILAQRLGDKFVDFMDKGKLICTNAYIQKGGYRTLPLSASINKEKNSSTKGRNRVLPSSDQEVQLTGVSNSYAYETDDVIYLADVEKQVRYHHSRPDDKGIGHVVSNMEESQFYQMESLMEGQTFAGKIYGSNEQLELICEILNKQEKIHIGYGKNTEYGRATMRGVALNEVVTKEAQNANTFIVKMNAATVLYNDNAMYSTAETDVKKALELLFGQEVSIIQRFVKYVEVGGYNVTWNAKKPTVLAFDKGTLFVCEVAEAININQYTNCFIGERNSEGYGEIAIHSMPQKYEVKLSHDWNEIMQDNASMKASDQAMSDMMRNIKKKKEIEVIEECAINKAIELKKSIMNQENASAIVNQVLHMFNEQNNEDDLKKALEARFNKDTNKKQTKKNVALKIIERDKTLDEQLKLVDATEIYEWYYKTLLVQLKYFIREKGV